MRWCGLSWKGVGVAAISTLVAGRGAAGQGGARRGAAGRGGRAQPRRERTARPSTPSVAATMSRTRVHSSIMASTAVAVLALLAASAVLAAPADRDTEGVAVADTPDKPTQAMLYEAADSDTASNKKDRKKKQTTTICVQVSPGRPGHAPAVLCGDKDDVDEQKRRFEMQRLLQTPVVQLQQQLQPGYFGSPHVVQIVPASDSVTVEAPGQSRADTVVVGPGAPATQGTFTFTAPLYRAADAAGQQQAQPSAQHSAQQAQPPQPAGVRAESKPATLEGHSLSGAFAATAPPMPAATAADHANKPQARSFGQDEIVVSQSGSGYGYGVHGPQQVTTVVTGGHDGYNMHGGASEVKVISGVQPGGFSSSMGSLGSLGYNQQPPMIGGMGMNYRAAEVAAAQPAALQQQQQQQQQQQANAQAANAQAAKTLAANAQAANAQAANAQAANAQAGANAASQQRTALLLQQPVVVRKEVVIPAVGSSLLTVQPAAQVRLPTLPEFLNPVSPLSGLGHLSPLATAQPLPQRADVRQQHTGQASIPITLNCDLSTLQYRGSPQQQLQLNLAQPGLFVTNARAAEKDLTDSLKQTLGAAMDAAVRNSTVTVHLNGSPAQANDLPKLQEELLNLQQREKALHETIEALKTAGSTHPEHAAAVVGLEHAAAQITKARAAVEQAIMQSGDAAPGARAADALGDAQSMTPAGLQDRMRSSAQFRYFPDPNLAIGPSSTVAVEMSPNVHGVFPRPHEKTTIVTTSSSNFGNPMGLGVGSGLGVGGGFGGGFGGSQHYGGGYRAAAPQPAQQQPQPAQQQPQPAQTQFQPAQQQPAQQRDEPLIQPAVPGSSSATQQKLLQQLREAQEDLMRMRAAAPPRDEPRQAAGNTNLNPTASPVGEEDFPATPGYQYLPKAAEAVPSQAPSQASFTMTTGPVSFSSHGNANGPAFLPAPESPKTHSARQASRYWRR